METIEWNDFIKVELRVGTIIEAQPFPEARKPAYKLTIDFGDYGILRSSAQITDHYTPATLQGRQIIAVVNLAPKKIAGFSSQCLVTGLADSNGQVVLLAPDKLVPNGVRVI
jgi:tRNA-binding protein